MVEFNLSEEQRALRELARAFVEQDVKPIVKEQEKIPDPIERFPWDIVEKASRLGLRTLGAPRTLGGGGADGLTLCVVGEELAAGDIGIATVFDQTCGLTQALSQTGRADQLERYLKPLLADDRALLAAVLPESGGGLDGDVPTDKPSRALPIVAAKREGGYVLNGTKPFVSLGSEASLYIVLARTDPEKRLSEGGLSGFLVPRGAPGLTIGKIHDKVGQRLANNADLVFEDCRVLAEDLLGGEGEFYPALRQLMRGANARAGAICLGAARAAYDAAVFWARQRVQGGKTIIQHHAVALMLADMATRIELGRLICWKAAWAADVQEPFDAKLPGMAKAYASESALEVCKLAMEIHGGYGIMKDLLLEKYLRDVSAMLHFDGTNQLHRLRITEVIGRGVA